MAKPRKTKKPTTRSTPTAKPEAVKPPVEAEGNEAVALETAPIAGDMPEGDTEVEAQQPEAVAEGEPTVEPEAEPTEPEPEPEPEPPVEPTVEPDVSSAGEGTVMLGAVECRAKFVPIDTVLGVLSEESLGRVEASGHLATTDAERKLMLATDGRATPVFFSISDDPEARPGLLHGYETISAARAIGRNDVLVVMVPQEGVDAASSHIVTMLQKRSATDRLEDEDDLVWRVHASD